jgi:hypothetical protein
MSEQQALASVASACCFCAIVLAQIAGIVQVRLIQAVVQ